MTDANVPPRQPDASQGFRRGPSPDAAQAALEAPMPAARHDLLISPQLYLGRTVYVVKDPVSLQYYRLQPAEHFILRSLDGRVNATQLAERVNERFPAQQSSPQDVVMFIQMLQASGLLLGRSETHAGWLREIARKRKSRLSRAKWLSFMFIKIPVLDPDHLLDWIYAHIRPLMNRVTMWLGIIFMIVSAVTAIFHIENTADLAFDILGWQNLLLLSVTFFAVKVIHEFGHGLAAKHRGLEVHEMGVLLMVFLPMFYVDVSDAWMVPRRRDRMWITAGGVFIEFLFAAIATWVWLGTDAGVVNQVAFNIMLAASVTTLLFNANPLLRYDGYYFLMDLLQIPNLRTKAGQYLGYLAKRFILAMPDQRPPREAATHPIFMPLYAIAASIYRWVVIFGIVALVWHILDPYGLEIIGSVLGTLAIITMVLLPAYKMLRFVWSQQARTARRALATVAGIAGLALLAWGILAVPVEDTVERPAVVLAPQRQPLFAQTPGRVVEVYARPNQRLAAGDPILRVDTTELRNELDLLRIDIGLLGIELERARNTVNPALAEAFRMRIDQHERRIEQLRTLIDRATIRAPIDGRVITRRRLNTSTGTWLRKGDAIGFVVGDGRHIEMVVPQRDVALIERDMTARVRLWGRPDHTIEATVERVGSSFLDRLPHEALSGRFSGEVDTRPDSTYTLAPATPSVIVSLAIDDIDPIELRDGLTGRGKIVLGRSSLGTQQWRLVRNLFSLDWWL